MINLLFAPTIIQCRRQPQCAYNCFEQIPQGKGFCTGGALIQVKTESFANGFLKNHQTDQIMTILWERGSESFTFLLSTGCEVTGFHYKCGLFLKANEMLEKRGWDLSKLKLQKLTLTKIWHFFFFFWINFLNCCKPLVKFQSSEELHSDNSGHFSHFLYRGENFHWNLLGHLWF